MTEAAEPTQRGVNRAHKAFNVCSLPRNSLRNLTRGSRKGTCPRVEAGSRGVCSPVLLLWTPEGNTGSAVGTLGWQNSAHLQRRRHF